MLKVTLSAKPDTAKQLLRFRESWQQALPKISAQVLADCNAFARDDTGAMIGSSYASSDLKNGRLVWRTPYAKRVYYTGKPSKAHNPSASLRWCEKAKGARLKAWVTLVTQTMRRVRI